MSLIPFPNIPNLPGVPALLRSATVPTVDSLVNNVISEVVEFIFGEEVWGVYDAKGNLAISADTFLGIEFKNNFRVSTYPQEEGAFATYNKVATPYDCRVQLAVGADKAARINFLGELDSMLKKIDTFNIFTPEATYLEATLQNYHYARKITNGVKLIEADLWFIEVRKNLSVAARTPKEPQAAEKVSQGQIQIFDPKSELTIGTWQ